MRCKLIVPPPKLLCWPKGCFTGKCMAKIPVGATISHAYQFAFQKFFAVLGIVWLPWAILAALGARVMTLGYVAAEQVSLWLQVAQLVLAPQVEGVNARKGTVMAALQHGRAVITTRGAPVSTVTAPSWHIMCSLFTPCSAS